MAKKINTYQSLDGRKFPFVIRPTPRQSQHALQTLHGVKTPTSRPRIALKKARDVGLW